MSEIKLTQEEVKKVQDAHTLVDTLSDVYINNIANKEVKAEILKDLSDAKLAFEKIKEEVITPKLHGSGEVNWSLDYNTGIVTITE